MLPKILGILALLAVGQVSVQAGPQAAFSTLGHNLDEAAHSLKLNASTNYVETMHLSSISSTEEYTVLNHPKHPGHSIRVKKTDFCDPTVKYVPSIPCTVPQTELKCEGSLRSSSVYTGYLDVDQGAKHLYFYFFESRRDPDNGQLVQYERIESY